MNQETEHLAILERLNAVVIDVRIFESFKPGCDGTGWSIMSNTLLGHLVLRLSKHPENLATEALAFLLKKSEVASSAFSQYLKALAPDIPDYLTYETQQVGLENSIPDLKCLDSDGKLRVIVENKFWAGLTDNQPVTYIKELRQAGSGLLVFVVPDARCGLIWDEVLVRCKCADITTAETEQRGTAGVAALGQGRYLAVVSWRSLLDALASAADLGTDVSLRNEILQLKGLCSRMDTEAFLPLRSDELTNNELARRIVNYCDLPFDIISEAESRGSHTSTSTAGNTGRWATNSPRQS